MKKFKVSVMGGGSFGTALGSLSARLGHLTVMYVTNPTVVEDINKNHANKRYFPEDLKLPNQLKATSDLKECLDGTNMIIHAIPVQKSYDFLMENKNLIPNNIPYIITSKGILIKQEKFFSDVWNDFFPEERNIKHCVLSGPSFAIEILKQSPTVVTLGCSDKSVSHKVQSLLHSSSFKTYTTDDVKGVEIGGALKNPLAIATGLCEGMGLGINTTSALVNRGLIEMSQFSKKFGGKSETLMGFSGIGDVMLTCLGALSRNKKVGHRLAKGESIDDYLNSTYEVAEGVPTLFVLDKIIDDNNLNMPLFKTLSKIVKGQITPEEGGKYLMLRDLEDETNIKI